MKELEVKVMKTSEHKKGEKNKMLKTSKLENIHEFCYHPYFKAKTKDIAEFKRESAITTVESELGGEVEEVGKYKKHNEG